MYWKNTTTRYGLVSRTLHWLMALMFLGLFVTGLYMTSLNYMHPWYKTLFDMHKSFGVLFLQLLLLRLFWHFYNPRPAFAASLKTWEKFIAGVTHSLLYGLLLLIPLSGYVISTANGDAIEVFGWYEIPAILSKNSERGDIAGVIHLALAIITMGLVILHSLAALKHHFLDKDETLLKMLGQFK